MKKIIIATLLIISSLLVFSACEKTGGDSTSATEATTDSPITEPSESVKLIISNDGQSEYKLCRSDSGTDEIISSFIKLRKLLTEKTEVKFEVITDFDDPKTGIAGRSPYEILVGKTNRDESTTAYKQLGYNDFGIFAIGTKLCIIGGCDSATVKAVEYFAANMLEKNMIFEDGFKFIQKAEYKAPDVKIDGVPLNEFKIVYGTSFMQYGKTLAERLGKSTGAVISVVSDKEEKNGHEIVLLSDKHDTAKTFDSTENYEIEVSGGNVYIRAGSKESLGSAITKFETLICEGKTSAEALSVAYKRPAREAYINDISLLALRWEGEFKPEDWLLDFNEKYAAMLDPNGRMITNIHRGDSIYYPENSIEGYISCIRMGADMIEIDPRLTKDGVFVLMHDATLVRTTDFLEKCGKNGLPKSQNLCDWTYEQLMQLNLKEGNGGTGAKVTDYKIPTLEEAIKVCAGRVFIRLDVKGPDSGGAYWDYEKDIWPLEVKYNSYDNIIYTWHSFITTGNYALLKKYRPLQKTACGRSAPFFIGCNANGSAKAILTTIKSNKFDPLVRFTDTDWATESVDAYLKRNEQRLAELKGNARVYVDAQNKGNNMKETPEYWNKLYNAGVSVLLCNESISFVRYIQENFQPSEIK